MKRAGFGTLLFDESEKAHPRVLDILLQILDAARITLASGETLDLSGFYVVLTSNLGAADVMQLQHAPLATMERHVLAKAQRSFRPELFARITEKLVFGRLSYDVQLEIAQQILASELAFLAEKGLASPAARGVLPFLVQRGFHPRLGARPMRDAVEKYVRDAVSRAALRQELDARAELCVNGDELVVDRNEHSEELGDVTCAPHQAGFDLSLKAWTGLLGYLVWVCVTGFWFGGNKVFSKSAGDW